MNWQLGGSDYKWCKVNQAKKYTLAYIAACDTVAINVIFFVLCFCVPSHTREREILLYFAVDLKIAMVLLMGKKLPIAIRPRCIVVYLWQKRVHIKGAAVRKIVHYIGRNIVINVLLVTMAPRQSIFLVFYYIFVHVQYGSINISTITFVEI